MCEAFGGMQWLPGRRGTRAATIANIVMIGPKELERDREHELVHVNQSMRAPLVYPLLYAVESLRHGYSENKYEVEAYNTTGSWYIK